MKIIIMKWFSSLCLLTGILCTNLNIYPFNIYFQSIGAISWIIVSYAVRDRYMMLNFLPQIPLFAIGYYVLLVGY